MVMLLINRAKALAAGCRFGAAPVYSGLISMLFITVISVVTYLRIIFRKKNVTRFVPRQAEDVNDTFDLVAVKLG